MEHIEFICEGVPKFYFYKKMILVISVLYHGVFILRKLIDIIRMWFVPIYAG